MRGVEQSLPLTLSILAVLLGLRKEEEAKMTFQIFQPF
jgi:hypothetical protein